MEVTRSTDAVLPSLDAGTDSPHPAFMFAWLVDGLVGFRHSHSGKLWVEVMPVKNLNDGELALNDLAVVLSRVEPNEVHISLPLRPPAEASVQPADENGLARAKETVGAAARIVPPIPEGVDQSEFEDLVEAVIAVIRRHSMEEEELVRTLAPR